jgi:superfamily II RNA helicase
MIVCSAQMLKNKTQTLDKWITGSYNMTVIRIKANLLKSRDAKPRV